MNTCKKCRDAYTKQRTMEAKEWAINWLGGHCFICGYNESHRALEFHHMNPSEKDVKAKYLLSWRRERMKKELAKCRCLCSNCHAEVHEAIDRIRQGVAQSGRVGALEAQRRRFESFLPDQFEVAQYGSA